MSDRLEGQNRSDPNRRPSGSYLDASEWDRLEEIGDLHYHASAFTSALDYYQRLLDEGLRQRLPVERCLEILRKSVDATLNLGNLDLAESLLTQATAYLDDASGLDPDEKNRLLAPLMGRRATVLYRRSAYEKALRVAKHAFAILAITDEHREVASLQVTMGACHHRLGRLEKAKEFYTDALATGRRIGEANGVALMYNNLALLAKNGCRWRRAQELMDKAIALAAQHGATYLLCQFYLNQGIILGKINRLGEARTVLEKSLRLSRSLGDRGTLAKACLAFGRLEIQTGRLARAEELVIEGKLLAEQERFLRESTIADEYLGDILLARGEVEKALYNYGLGLEKTRALGKVNDLEGELLRRMAQVQRRLGRLAEAIESGLAAIAVCEKCGEVYEIGFCYRTLGHAYADNGEWQQADTHFRKAIATFRQQKLPRECYQAILSFYEARVATAGQAELLLLRRYLLEAQEEGSSALSDRMLCRLLEAVADVQLRLGQLDDALLTVYELERNASGQDDVDLERRVAELRAQMEGRLIGGLEASEDPLRAFTGVPGLFNRRDRSVPRNLTSVLAAGLERVSADSGFIALERCADNLDIVAREGLTENLGEQLARWYVRTSGEGDAGNPLLFSRLTSKDSLPQAVPALRSLAHSCVFMPIALHGRRFGLLFLAKGNGNVPRTGFDRPELDFLATYMGFLALFLFEKGRVAVSGDAERARTPIEGVESFENVITRNEAMLDVLALIRKVASSDLTVLLNGETGTGKGLLAYALHGLSRRRERKFLAINCAAIPESLLESELFGHVKGSFTGAHADKRGLLSEAEGGTVFLDEIGKMPLSMQAKLLHFLDTRVVRPVGSTQEHWVDVRIVCASKTDLHRLAQEGLFLEDLFYRLRDFPLDVPPLRERRDDIHLLAQHFIERFAPELEMEPPSLGVACLDALLQHDWPGNIRELEKVLKRALVLAQGDGVLSQEHLPTEIAGYAVGGTEGGTVPPLKETLAAVECREITHTLKITEGNKSKAARLLRISYPNLLKKIRHYGIQRD